MPVLRSQKEASIVDLREQFRKAKIAVLVDNKGLSVAQMTKLRKDLREAGVTFKVAKNTLIRIAAKAEGVNGLDPYLNGPTVVAFSTDLVAPAKKLTEFLTKEKNAKLELKAAYLEGEVFGADKIKSIAELPPREVLIAQVIAGVQAPLVGVVGAVNGILSGVVYAIDARLRQLEAEPA